MLDPYYYACAFNKQTFDKAVRYFKLKEIWLEAHSYDDKEEGFECHFKCFKTNKEDFHFAINLSLEDLEKMEIDFERNKIKRRIKRDNLIVVLSILFLWILCMVCVVFLIYKT